MALSVVQVDNPMALVRAASWTNALARLGLHLPLFVVHDLGVLITVPRGPGGWTIRPRESQLAQVAPPASARGGLEGYRKLLETIAAS